MSSKDSASVKPQISQEKKLRSGSSAQSPNSVLLAWYVPCSPISRRVLSLRSLIHATTGGSVQSCFGIVISVTGTSLPPTSVSVFVASSPQGSYGWPPTVTSPGSWFSQHFVAQSVG